LVRISGRASHQEVNICSTKLVPFAGHITILDHDTVDLSNLHRQVLHSEATVGINKAESARRSLVRYATRSFGQRAIDRLGPKGALVVRAG
jgi:molybdopterin/thiamine biosynthesis adenylyltransferase